jgi:excisionase family DNA binding protein
MVESVNLSLSFSELQELIEKTLISTLAKYNFDQTQINDQVFTPSEAADYLKISKVTLWSWTKNNYIPYVKKGKVVRYTKNEIDKALHSMSKTRNGGHR